LGRRRRSRPVEAAGWPANQHVDLVALEEPARELLELGVVELRFCDDNIIGTGCDSRVLGLAEPVAALRSLRIDPGRVCKPAPKAVFGVRPPGCLYLRSHLAACSKDRSAIGRTVTKRYGLSTARFELSKF
jgi:hypothetical protein